MPRIVNEGQSQVQMLGLQDPRLSFPACTSLSFQGRSLPPATWKPFVLNQPPSSPSLSQGLERRGPGDPTHFPSGSQGHHPVQGQEFLSEAESN